MVPNDPPSSALKSYTAVYTLNGTLRRLHFEAVSDSEAQRVCATWGAGLEGPASFPRNAIADAMPVAYNEKTARKLLGGISQATLYRWLAIGKVERVPDTRRILITRSSIERQSRPEQV